MTAPDPVRRAVPADAEALAACHARSWPRPWEAAAFQRFLADPAMQLLCLEAGTGFVLFQIAGPQADLVMVAVDPSLRGQGRGALLVRTGLAGLVASGVESVFLEVGAHNAAALGLYRSLGFEQVGMRRGYYPPTPDDPGDALVLRKDLAA